MTMRSTIAKSAVALAAGAMALSAAATAAAQPYGQYGYYGDNAGYAGGYDPCRRESTGRSVVGALLGGAIGASIGANAAAKNARQDGALLGGAVGALAGAAVGKNGAACTGQAPGYAPAPSTAYGSPYGSSYGSTYGSAYATPYQQPYAYNTAPGYYDRSDYGAGRRYRGYDDRDWAYGHRGERYRLAGREIGADGCTLAESPIYMPDGRTQTRFVRVCRDSSGRYQVVD